MAKRIGIIGGGQLGKMMILDAKRMGFYVTTLDPTADCPSHSVSDEHIVAGFNDMAAFKRLAEKSDVVTYELEHVSVDALDELELDGHTVYPSAKSLRVIQDKLSQKTALKNGGIPVPDFAGIASVEDAFAAGEQFSYPYMLKTRTGGYDGKGNAVVNSPDCVRECYDLLGNGVVPLMAERFEDFVMEISVLACRGTDGYTVVYPVGENRHVNSILDETCVPAALPERTYAQALDVAKQVMEVFKGVGMFCVEMFVLRDGSVSVNEVAPRPHNSGHYTIEGCAVSQFEQHIRAITGLPLGGTSLLKPCVMRNLLGEDGFDGPALISGAAEALAINGVKLHIYGKALTKPARKMGHLTASAETLEEAAENAAKAKSSIQIKSSIRILVEG